MSDSRDSVSVPDTSLWEFVPSREYRLPSSPIAYAVRGGITLIWRRLLPVSPEPAPLFDADDDLERLADEHLQQIAADIEWHDAAVALSTFLLSRLLGEQTGPSVICFASPPYSGMSDMLTLLAQKLQWRLCPPPTVEQILSQDITCVEPLHDDATYWIIPNLADWYLGHTDGLSLVRHLVELVHCRRIPLA